MSDALNWFEIPATDFDRACTFYEGLLDITLDRQDLGGILHGVFQSSLGDGVGGAVLADASNSPSSTGTRVYLDAADIPGSLARVADLGGEALTGVNDLGPIGTTALIRDTEGNVVGLHTPAAG